PHHPAPPLFPYTTLFRSRRLHLDRKAMNCESCPEKTEEDTRLVSIHFQVLPPRRQRVRPELRRDRVFAFEGRSPGSPRFPGDVGDRKSTRLNSSHVSISY